MRPPTSGQSTALLLVLVRADVAPRATHANPRDRLGNDVSTLLRNAGFALLTRASATRVLGMSCRVPRARVLIIVYSVQRGGRVEIIANDQGHRITPSWVAFSDEERLYASSAYAARLSVLTFTLVLVTPPRTHSPPIRKTPYSTQSA